MTEDKPPSAGEPLERDALTARIEANIRAEIRAAGLSSRAVRNRMGGNSTALADFLSGKSRSLRADTIARVAEALEVPVDRLLAPPPDKGELQAELLALIGTLRPEEVRVVLKLMRALSEDRNPPAR